MATPTQRSDDGFQQHADIGTPQPQEGLHESSNPHIGEGDVQMDVDGNADMDIYDMQAKAAHVLYIDVDEAPVNTAVSAACPTPNENPPAHIGERQELLPAPLEEPPRAPHVQENQENPPAPSGQPAHLSEDSANLPAPSGRPPRPLQPAERKEPAPSGEPPQNKPTTPPKEPSEALHDHNLRDRGQKRKAGDDSGAAGGGSGVPSKKPKKPKKPKPKSVKIEYVYTLKKLWDPEPAMREVNTVPISLRFLSYAWIQSRSKTISLSLPCVRWRMVHAFIGNKRRGRRFAMGLR
jgi:hypothetical protein